MIRIHSESQAIPECDFQMASSTHDSVIQLFVKEHIGNSNVEEANWTSDET